MVSKESTASPGGREIEDEGQPEPEKASHESQSESKQPASERPDFGGEKWNDLPLDPIAEDISLLPTRPGRFSVGGSSELNASELSDDGRKLLEVLRREAGDTELLPIFAERLGFDLEKAKEELRAQEVLDESDPERLKLIRRWIE